MPFSRRFLLKQASLLSLFALYTKRSKGQFPGLENNLAKDVPSSAYRNSEVGNFNFIYKNEEQQREFLSFLKNVFNLYPEDEFHKLLISHTLEAKSDNEIYLAIQSQLDSIKPFLGELTYTLPALFKQKAVISKQTRELLGETKTVEGYLELGTTGRYVGALNDHIDFKGRLITCHDIEPSFSPVDMIERGQISKIGDHIRMNEYKTVFTKKVEKNSLDLVTVYIGLHHCPPDLRDSFIGSLCDTLKPGGKMIIRDHDAHNEYMNRMVSLAHDVFNMGTLETWDFNEKEERHFYSLDYLVSMMAGYGLKTNGVKLFQEGDPTKNALMIFEKA